GAIGSGSPAAVGVSSDGNERWATALSVGPQLAAWPVPVCGRTSARAIWATTPATVQVTTLDSGSARSTIAIQVDGSIEGLDAAFGDALTIVVAGDRGLRSIAVLDGRAQQPVMISQARVAAPAACAIRAGTLVSWLDPSASSVMARRLIHGMPGGEEETVVSSSDGETMMNFHLLGTHADMLGLTWT